MLYDLEHCNGKILHNILRRHLGQCPVRLEDKTDMNELSPNDGETLWLLKTIL